MRRVALAGLLAVAGCGRTSLPAPAFDGARAHGYVVHMVEAGPRVPNTPGHKAVGDWLVAQLRQSADTVEVQEWVHVTARGDTLHLRNIFARFRPAEAGRVLYVSHWDSKPHAESDPDTSKRREPVPGANDGGSSTAMLLVLAEELKKQPPTLGVDLLFVDGEDYGSFEGDSPDNLIGSRWFARHLPTGYQPLFGVLWDMIGDFSQEFAQEGHSLQRAPEVVERVWNTARDIGHSRVFRDRQVGFITDDHVPLLDAGLRVIDVIDCCGENYPAWHTTHDTPDKVSPGALTVAGQVALALVR